MKFHRGANTLVRNVPRRPTVRLVTSAAPGDRVPDWKIHLDPAAAGWRSSVLTARYPVDWDLYLNGRGLALVPSAFCWQYPITLIDPELPPALVYPAVGQQPGWWASPPGTRGGKGLINLLGDTPRLPSL